MPGPAARLSATPPRLRRAAPAPGADGASVLGERRSARDATPPPGGARSRPLEGLRSLALTQVWAGAHCAQQLALLGAEVIKIEARRRPDTWRGGYEMRDPRRPAGPPDGAPRLELPPVLQLRQPQPARRHARPPEARGHPPLPPAAALDRHRRRELYAARARQPRDLLRGDARAAAGRDPLLDQRLRRGRPLPRSPLQRRAQSSPPPACRRCSASPGGPPRNSGATFPDPLAAMTATTAILAALEHRARHGRGAAHRRLDAGSDARAGRRRGAGARADRPHARPAGQTATWISRRTASTPRAARTAGSPSPPRTTRSGRNSVASPHAPTG